MSASFWKDPQAVLDYSFDWSPWLVSGDTITNLTATATPVGITINSVAFTTTSTTVNLSGGVVGVKYAVVHHITTSGARQDDRTMFITVVEK